VFKKILSVTTIVSFLFTSIGPITPAHADFILNLPAPGTMVSVSSNFEPALIRGLTVHRDNPFLFDFIVDPGQSKLSGQTLKDESDRMIKYFFASLTIPDKDIWVNLSPYEKDRMVPQALGETAMGRDLLAQDYMLKQLTASLIYPQKNLGKIFWDRVYAKAKEMYGTTEIPVNTFNKIWIVPQKVGIYEHGQTAFIVEGHLKVMLEEDYLSLTKHNAITNLQTENDTHKISSQIIRQIILPEIEKEVNTGNNFATLRQIFYASALAVWFKNNLKQALLNRAYANKNTVKGIDQNDSAVNEAIYQQYLKAYKKGVFNFIQEDRDLVTKESLPHKYFSGGMAWGTLLPSERIVAQLPRWAVASIPRDFIVTAFTATNAKLAEAANAVSKQGSALMVPAVNIQKIITALRGNIHRVPLSNGRTKVTIDVYSMLRSILQGRVNSNLLSVSFSPSQREEEEAFISKRVGEPVSVSEQGAISCAMNVSPGQFDQAMKVNLYLLGSAVSGYVSFLLARLTYHNWGHVDAGTFTYLNFFPTVWAIGITIFLLGEGAQSSESIQLIREIISSRLKRKTIPSISVRAITEEDNHEWENEIVDSKESPIEWFDREKG